MNDPFRLLIPTSTGCIAVVVLLMALTADAAAAQSYVRLQNRWTSDYVHVENGVPGHGKIREGWFSAMWVLETVPGTDYRRLKNRYTNKYLHVQNGPLQQGDVEEGWFSAMWTMEPVPTTDYYRLKNRYTNKYLHVEGGPLQVGEIEMGWLSAMWTVAPAGACKAVLVEAGPIWNDDDADGKCPPACDKANGTWSKQWRTTVEGKMSVCECSVC